MSRRNPRGVHPVIAKLRAARKEIGLTQEDVAEACGLGARTVPKWERGVTNPQLHNLTTYAALVGLRLELVPSEP